MIKAPLQTDGYMTVDVAARYIGVEPAKLTPQVECGVVASVQQDGVPMVPHAEAERWRKYFITITPGFEFMQPGVLNRTQLRLIIPEPDAKGMLDVRKNIMDAVIQESLLPYFVSSFNPKDPQRLFMIDYIQGFLIFVGNGPIKSDRLRVYKSQCTAARKIV